MAHPSKPVHDALNWDVDLNAALDVAYDRADQKIAQSTGTTKGDMLVYNGSSWVRLGVGSNTQILIADSAQTTGVKWGANTGSSSTGVWDVLVTVTSDGTTNAATAIQSVLTGLAAGTHSYEVIVQGTTQEGVIFLNGSVRITTSNTKVRFKNPVKFGTGMDPDGFGCLSIRGTTNGTTTVTAGTAVRGNTTITVGSTTNITVNSLVRIYDNDATNGSTAGDKAEMAEIIDIVGTTLYLDHPLHHTFTGTVTLEIVIPVTNSGFEDVDGTFSGQQTAGFTFPMKYQHVRNCYARNIRLKGDKNNSWAREAINLRYGYRVLYENCNVTFAWNYGVGSTYSYGFSCDSSTVVRYTNCVASYLRHGFSMDRGASDVIYTGCVADKVIASGYDLHGNWTRDVTYIGCHANGGGDGYNANDGQHFGFLSGNTTFLNGSQYISYIGCTARNFVNYTTNTSATGNAAGFGVVDNGINILFDACRVIESEQGWLILSQLGTPITNVTIQNCEFNNGVGAAQLPIYVNAGAAPQDVNGLIVDGFKIVNSATVAAMRIYGNSGNQLSDIVITGCVWNRSQGTSGVHSIDARYVDNLVISHNTFNRTRRGVALQNCPSAVVTNNTFVSLTEPNEVIRDSGGNTSMYFGQNSILGTYPATYGTAPTSTTPFIDITAPVGRTTAQLPALTAASAGVTAWDSTLSKLVVWTGSAWTAVH